MSWIDKIRILKREKLNRPINMIAGDTVVLNYTDDNGKLVEAARHTVCKSGMINEAVVFESDDLFDMKNVVGGAFGKKK